MKSIIVRRILAGVLGAGVLLSFTPRARQIAALPSQIDLPAGQEYVFDSLLPDDELQSSYLAAAAQSDEHLSDNSAANSFVTLSFMGLPIRRVALNVTEKRMVIPGGHSIGVALRTRGVLVVGVSDISTNDGTICPAKAADLRAGESIEQIDGADVNSVSEFTRLLTLKGGNPIQLTIAGDSGRRTATVTPVLDPHDNQYRLGAWVRDSTAGVGTLSFYDPQSAGYGALGHAICDVDTGDILTVSDGEILKSDIVAIKEGTKGSPGELRGAFMEKAERMGSISENLKCGIYGSMYSPIANPLYPSGITVSNRTLAHTGAAQILTTLDSSGIKAYDCQITQVFKQDTPSTRSMIIKITDPELIERTGGIVQGMSGSPIIQDGMLLGAVTHVFVNDPTQGYGIYIDWMLQASDGDSQSMAA